MKQINWYDSLPSSIYVPVGVTPHFSRNEQNPATFDPQTSLYLPPIGVDPNGKPYYHKPNDGSGMEPYTKQNHMRADYRVYKDAKDAALTAGTLPVWVWIIGGMAAIGVGILVASR